MLSVDEKPSIQALERATGYVLTSSGKIVQGLKSTYKRHGTVNLFAALEVATGVIRGKTTKTKKRVDFQAFMSEYVEDQPSDREIHVILNNYCPHTKTRPGLLLTPTSRSISHRLRRAGLTRSSIWFGNLYPKALSGASFRSAEQLEAGDPGIHRRLQQRAAPFVWRKREVKGAQLRHTIVNLCN